MLPNFDPDLVEVLMAKFREIGVDVRIDTAVEGIEKDGSGFVVRAMSDGQPMAFKADLVVHSAGRGPALESLDLDAGGLAHHKGRLKLNEFLQSVSNPAVYAAGDAAQMGPPLTPVSSHDAKIVAANLLNGNAQTPNYLGVPSVAFTIPPIAAVGLSERDARAQGLRFRTQHQTASEWFTARQAAEPTYAFKVMVEDKTDRILGAHLVGPHADEVINLFALAIRQGITAAFTARSSPTPRGRRTLATCFDGGGRPTLGMATRKLCVSGLVFRRGLPENRTKDRAANLKSPVHRQADALAAWYLFIEPALQGFAGAENTSWGSMNSPPHLRHRRSRTRTTASDGDTLRRARPSSLVSTWIISLHIRQVDCTLASARYMAPTPRASMAHRAYSTFLEPHQVTRLRLRERIGVLDRIRTGLKAYKVAAAAACAARPGPDPLETFAPSAISSMRGGRPSP